MCPAARPRSPGADDPQSRRLVSGITVHRHRCPSAPEPPRHVDVDDDTRSRIAQDARHNRRGHTARGSVAPTGSGGWTSTLTIASSSPGCTDWHRVERLCAELQWNAGTARAESFTPTLQVCGGLEDRHVHPSDAPTWIDDSLASAITSQHAVVRAHQVLAVRGSSSLKRPPFAHVRATCVVSLVLV